MGVPVTGPSAIYRASLWRLGCRAAGLVPLSCLQLFTVLMVRGYRRLRPAREAIVVENLRPFHPDDPAAAAAAARRLFVNFGRKLADLMRFEAGRPVAARFVALNDWDRFRAMHDRGAGVLMVTPHLGNWEIGAPLLIERGVKLLIVTQAEPQADLTLARHQARDRWGVETLVIGGNTFAVVEIIKRLQEGACVAMLIDRPPASSSVPVELCGRPFAASIAPAELARASGCALAGVTLVEEPGGYTTRVLPEFTYDRRALGDREQRLLLTQRLITAFEPVIRQHLDQWYHFVPVWPPDTAPPSRHR